MIYSHSQNFLFKKDLVEELVRKTNFSDDDVVLDIGAGNGIINEIIQKKVKKI